jgi:signal transduction histidine kinase
MAEVAGSKKILIGTLAVSFFLGIIISLYFIRSITKPIEELLSATRQIKSGELQYQIEKKLPDEFGELATSFNEMAASIQDQYKLLQKTERLAVVGELAAGMAHEIKNPMAGIKVAMEVLNQDSPLGPEDKAVLHRVIKEIDRITALLKGLLSYARPPKPEMHSLDVNQILETSINSAQYALQKPKNLSGDEAKQQIKIVKKLNPDIPTIVADPNQLQQVFLNLLLNAVDAIASSTEEQGIITVQSRHPSGKAIEIIIADNGKGIESQALGEIFKPFYTTKHHGTGLGLAITKRLVDQHKGGNITAAHNPEGQGVIFTITLPLDPTG